MTRQDARRNIDGALVPEWTVGDRLRKARELSGIKVEEMAERLGRQRNSIRRWERSANAQTMVIKTYALETNVSAEWLEHGVVAPDPSGGVSELQDRRSRRSEQGGGLSGWSSSRLKISSTCLLAA